MTKMSRKAALVIATECISKIDGQDCNWHFRVPVSADDLDGPTKMVRTETYAQARRKRTEAVVQLALNLIGVHGTIEFRGNETGNARQVLDLVMADADAYIDPQ